MFFNLTERFMQIAIPHPGSHICSGCALHWGTIWLDDPRDTGSSPVKSPWLESLERKHMLMKSNRCSKCLFRPFRTNIYIHLEELSFQAHIADHKNNNVGDFSDSSLK